MRYTYPHKIDNGFGEELTFVQFVENENGGMLEIENRVQPGAGPPMHLHHKQDESLTVIQGKIAAHVLGHEPTFHGPGETVTFKKGVPHRFWNAGDEILICHGWASPAYNMEYFLTEIFNSAKTNGGKPSPFDGAYLQTKYKSEFDLLEIPAFVKNFVFPVVVALGRVAGKYRKYEDGPTPF
jgi:mannose-6-phosphate isomerase-like protein (cupin superfamily)